jgi:tetratricopeptide (TPR) repeat protein
MKAEDYLSRVKGLMKYNIITLIAVVGFFLLSSVPPSALSAIPADTGSIESFSRWYSEFAQGSKIGYTHKKRERSTLDGKPVIISTSETHLSYSRMGTVMNSTEITTYYESLDRKPIKFESTSSGQGAQPVKTEGTFNGNTIEITSSSYGNVSKSTINTSGTVLFPYAIDHLTKQNLGSDFNYQTIIPSIGVKVVTVENNYLEKTPTDILGENYELYKYQLKLDAFGAMQIFDWYDHNAISYKSTASLMNSATYLTTEEDAKKSEGTKKVDIMNNSVIIVKTVIPDPRDVKQVLYKITVKNGTPEDLFIQDHRQKIMKQSLNDVFLEVNAYLPDYLLYTYPFTEERFKPYLRDNNFIQPGHSQIALTAKKVVGNQKNAYLAAKKLEKWVYNNIKDKNFDVGFATASETIETLKGDCTEHAILLASLCRSVGIPAQIVAGLEYIPLAGSDDSGMFMYHMWTEVYVGEWIQLDATNASRDVADATHIALMKSSLNNTEEESKLYTAALNAIGNLEIEIINYASATSGLFDVTSQASMGAVTKMDLSELNRQGLDSSQVPIASINLDQFKGNTTRVDSFNITGLPNVSPVLETYEGNFTKGMAHYAKGNIDHSIAYFNKAVELIPPDDAKKHYDMGVRLAGIMMFSLAENVFDKAININDELWSKKAKIYEEENFPKGHYSNTAEKYNMTGFSFSNFANNYPAAILMYEKAIDNSPNFDSAIYNLGRANYMQMDYETALRNYNQALNINPRNTQALAGIGQIYEEMGNYNEAIDAYQNIINIGKDDQNFINNIKYNLASLKARQMINANPNNASAYIMVGNAALQNEQFDQAKSAFIKALNINKNLADAHAGLGKAFFFSGETIEGEEELKKAVNMGSGQKDALLYLGIINKRRLEYNTALGYINKAISLDRNNKEYAIELGRVYMNMEDYPRAIQAFSRATNPEGYYWLGLAYAYKGNKAQAKDSFNKSINLNPYDARPYKELSKIYLEENDLFQARDHAEKAVDLDTNYADAYFVLGLIEEQEGNKTQAVDNYVKSYVVNQSSKEAYLKAYQIFEEMDELEKFQLPQPKYIPTKQEKEYLIRLLYFESVRTQENLKFADTVLNNCPMGFFVAKFDIVGKAILKKAESNYSSIIQALYKEAMNELEPPEKLTALNKLFLDKLWTEANFHHQQMYVIDVGISSGADKFSTMFGTLSDSFAEMQRKQIEFSNFISSLLQKWDPISVDEIVTNSGLNIVDMKELQQKQDALIERTNQAMQKYSETAQTAQ